MSALKEALQTAINQWEESHVQQEKQMEQPKDHLFKTTNNVTRATFNAVRDTPGCKRKAILFGLERQGYKLASTTSILSQMIKQRLVREEADGKLYANFEEYVPLKATSKPKAKPVKKAKVQPQAQAGIAALQPVSRSAIITTNFDVDNILKNLTILQAKALRDALNNLFK
jgi:hypothetical protein